MTSKILNFESMTDEYIKNFDVSKNDINKNTKVFYLLTMKLKKELQEHYINYILSMSDDEELNKNLTIVIKQYFRKKYLIKSK